LLNYGDQFVVTI